MSAAETVIPPSADDLRAFSIAESADRLNVGRTSFYEQLIMPGKIRTVRVGRRVLIPASEIARILGEGA